MSREEFAMEMAKKPADFYYGVMWNKLYRREIVRQQGLFCDTSMNWCEDFLFNLEYIRYADRFLALQKPVYYYQKRKGSLVATEAVSADAVRVKFELLERYKALYQSMGLYEEHKLKINSYIVAIARDGGAGRMNPRKQKLPSEDVIPEDERSRRQHVEHTFDPVCDSRSEYLILGTFPSVKSREQNFYYGHPQNRFWKVLAAVTKAAVPETVAQKQAFLLEQRIALWDVIASCEIQGSSDSSIREAQANDVAWLLRESGITRVYVNGGKAAQLYDKLLLPKTELAAVRLPSTSPANAAWSLPRLVDAWRVIAQ